MHRVGKKAGFKRAFDELNLVILEARAMRLFGICDLDRSGRIGISELEVALMINDIVPTTSYLTPLDSLYTFDLDGDGDISWVEFKVMGYWAAGNEGRRATMLKEGCNKLGWLICCECFGG